MSAFCNFSADWLKNGTRWFSPHSSETVRNPGGVLVLNLYFKVGDGVHCDIATITKP